MANPLASAQDQIPQDLDPKAKAIVGQLMGQLQQAKQQLQQLNMEKEAKIFGVQEREKLITDRQTMAEFAETHRTHLRDDAEMQRAELDARTKMSDILSRDSTDIRETLIDAHTNLEIAHRQALNRGSSAPNKAA